MATAGIRGMAAVYKSIGIAIRSYTDASEAHTPQRSPWYFYRRLLKPIKEEHAASNRSGWKTISSRNILADSY